MERREQFESSLREMLRERWTGSPLLSILEYALFPGGKRLRPLLCLAVCEDLGGSFKDALGVAAAVECLHIASLIHDDLPCLDNDSLRRGQPTCHVRFSEADALLAGDALSSWAFELGARSSRSVSAMVLVLSRAFSDLCVGQLKEIRENSALIASKLANFELKTGALFGASLRLGSLVALGENEELERLWGDIGRDFGVLFQAQDDLEDGETDSISQPILQHRWESMGKSFTSIHEATKSNLSLTKSILGNVIKRSFSE